MLSHKFIYYEGKDMEMAQKEEENNDYKILQQLSPWRDTARKIRG